MSHDKSIKLDDDFIKGINDGTIGNDRASRDRQFRQEFADAVKGCHEFSRQLLRDNCVRCGEILDRLEKLEQAASLIAAHLPGCPADVLPDSVFSCDDILNCHGPEGIKACWRRVLGVDGV